jgi:hypothetical protein
VKLPVRIVEAAVKRGFAIRLAMFCP